MYTQQQKPVTVVPGITTVTVAGGSTINFRALSLPEIRQLEKLMDTEEKDFLRFVPLMYSSAAKAQPDLTIEKFESELTLADMVPCFEAMMIASGLKTPEKKYNPNPLNQETKPLQLQEGTITLRAIPADDLKVSAAVSEGDPARALKAYMLCIQQATVDVIPLHPQAIPSDITPFEYVLSMEDHAGLWRIVRTLYEMAGEPLPAVVPLA